MINCEYLISELRKCFILIEGKREQKNQHGLYMFFINTNTYERVEALEWLFNQR